MEQLTYQIFKQIDEVPSDWDDISTNIFLNSIYLQAQELSTPENIDHFYIAIYQNSAFVGKAVVQRIRLRGKELFRDGSRPHREELINLLNLNILCVGNIKVTGEHAFIFKSEINQDLGIQQIKLALNEIRKVSKKEGLPIQLMLFKDFYEDRAIQIQSSFRNYEKLSVQPNMVFEVKNDWNSFEDYLNAMRAKYRTRAKRAFRLGEGIDYQNLDLEGIRLNNDRIYELYLNVLKNNKFSIYKLPKNYFEVMKLHLKNNFQFVAGFKDDKMVSFYTLITHDRCIETGFLGYDAENQHEHQLYLNMLYQMIKFAIEKNYESIDFSRTALEIKSSVGAEPRDMFGFLKHNQPLMNKILRSTFRKFYQSEEWVQRSPYKN